MPERPSLAAWVPAALALVAAAAVLLAHDAGGAFAHSGDGRLHDAYAYEIAAGVLPPSDPRHLGEPATIAWTWHIALWGLSALLDVPPWRASAWLSAACAAAVVLMMWAATGLYTRRPLARAAIAWSPFLLLDPFAALALWGRSPSPGNLTAAIAAYDPFATGIAMVSAATLVLVSRRWSSRPRLLSAALIGLLATLVHPPAALALVPLGAAPLLAALWEYRSELRFRTFQAIRESMPGLGLLAGAAAGAALWPRSTLALFTPAFALPDPAWALAPALAMTAAALLRWDRLTRTTRALAVAAIGLAALPLLFGEPDTRTALVLLAAPLDAVLLLALLDELAPAWRSASDSGARGRTAASSGALLLAGLAMLGTGAALRSTSATVPAPFASAGTHTDLHLTGDGPAPRHRQGAWAWLRENTPAAAVIVEEPVPTARLDLPVVSRRRTLVALDGVGPNHDLLVERTSRFVRRLASCELAPADVARLFSTPAPWPRSVYAITPIPPGGSACASPPEGVKLVHANPGYAIYVVMVPRR